MSLLKREHHNLQPTQWVVLAAGLLSEADYFP